MPLFRASVFALIGIALSAGLGGCATLSGTLTVEAYLNREITGDTFAACTARGYQAVARRKAWRERNFADAVLLADKAQAAQSGSRLEFFPADLRASAKDRISVLSDAATDARKSLASAGPHDCHCGGVASAFDDWVLESLAGDWDGAKARFAAAQALCDRQS
jgi:hypothetical protein